jgi:hypothetical protein
MPADVIYTNIPGPRHVDRFGFVDASRQRQTRFILNVEARTMARSTAVQGVPWDTFRWVVGGLLGLIIVLVGGGFGWLITDVREVRTEIAETRRDIAKEIADTRVQLVKEISETSLELTKAIGAVQTQAVGTNTKLDDLISVMRQRR